MVKLGIIGAMTVEVQTLKEQIMGLTVTEKAGMEFFEGTLGCMSAVIVQCGVGKVNAAMCAQLLCDRFGATHIVNTGVAGSLCAELDIGDFVISNQAMYHDFDCHTLNPDYPVGQVPGMSVRMFPADENLMQLALKAANQVHQGHARVGTIASGDQFVCDKQVKQTIITNTRALCTEMEGAAIAHTAWRNGVPFVVIRAISDKADDSAEMDYPTFEAVAAKRCAEVTKLLAEYLTEK